MDKQAPRRYQAHCVDSIWNWCQSSDISASLLIIPTQSPHELLWTTKRKWGQRCSRGRRTHSSVKSSPAFLALPNLFAPPPPPFNTEKIAQVPQLRQSDYFVRKKTVNNQFWKKITKMTNSRIPQFRVRFAERSLLQNCNKLVPPHPPHLSTGSKVATNPLHPKTCPVTKSGTKLRYLKAIPIVQRNKRQLELPELLFCWTENTLFFNKCVQRSVRFLNFERDLFILFSTFNGELQNTTGLGCLNQNSTITAWEHFARYVARFRVAHTPPPPLPHSPTGVSETSLEVAYLTNTTHLLFELRGEQKWNCSRAEKLAHYQQLQNSWEILFYPPIFPARFVHANVLIGRFVDALMSCAWCLCDVLVSLYRYVLVMICLTPLMFHKRVRERNRKPRSTVT